MQNMYIVYMRGFENKKTKVSNISKEVEKSTIAKRQSKLPNRYLKS
jgi:hypothetical protein